MAAIKPRLAPMALRGTKAIYLPEFVITLLRTPKLSPHFAKFHVPLSFNKLDLQNYLYNAYNIEVQHVRSTVVQRAVRANSHRDTRPAMQRWHRPSSKKYMTVQMAQPFVWPPEPEDYSPWDRDTYEKANDQRDGESEKRMPDANEKQPEDTDTLKEQAERLLSGQETWQSGARDARSFTRTMVSRRGSKKGVAAISEVRPT